MNKIYIQLGLAMWHISAIQISPQLFVKLKEVYRSLLSDAPGLRISMTKLG